MLLSGIIATFKSYPTLGDSTVWLGLLGCFPDIWDDLRHPLLTASLVLYSTLLLPILLELWLVSATGNANFMYAATMVHSLGCGLGVLDVLGAALRSGVLRETIKLLDADARRLSAGDKGGVEKELDVVRRPCSVISAKRVLEEHDLVVVQYTTLGDDEQ
ncbi:hypothetical protein QFC21_000545 [Naganishia friedmannii]|uniref:Uncharacterized protein n=1 Tax=Naganishia friedmannii TaxID=89922 RepID=A0ACC2WDT1_9TREE|nr:hypothetical protein QFC21_000545 [Naganishia friedmannii]